jgi:hypothetical protein
MPGIRPVFEKGSPLTFAATSVANGGNMRAGILVEPDGTTGKIKPAVAGSTRVLGLLLTNTVADNYGGPAAAQDAWGNDLIDNSHQYPNTAAVASSGVWDLVVASAVAFGQHVKAGADGTIVADDNGGAATFGQIVGQCVEPGGIANGAKGRIRLSGSGI